MLGGADEELVAGGGWRGKRVGVVEAVRGQELEGGAGLHDCDVGGFANEVEFAVG